MSLQSPLEEIHAIRERMEAAENAGDWQGVLRDFHEDAIGIVPDFPVQEGKAECAEFLSELLPALHAAFVRPVKYSSEDVTIHGDLAFDRGTFWITSTPREGGETVRTTGKYFCVLARNDRGKWRITHWVVTRDEDLGDEDE